MELGELDKAAEGFNTILERDPTQPDIYLFLGNIYGMQGNMGEAHYYLGKHYQLKGSWKTSVVHLVIALSLITDPSQKDESETMLKRATKTARDESLEKEVE